MASTALMEKVKKSLGITGDYQDSTVSEYIDEVLAFLSDAGIPEELATPGLVARGVSDLWTYGTGEFSPYFLQRATQLSYKGGGS